MTDELFGHVRYLLASDYQIGRELGRGGRSSLVCLRGALPRRAIALILEWVALHREELLEDWNLCATKQMPRKITPLP